MAVGALDVLDVIDGVAHAGVLGDALVGEVNLAGLLVDGDILEQCVAADGVVDVRLGLGVEVDDLGIAAALEVEHALVVPAVLVVADELALGVGAECGLTGARQTEEDGGVLAIHVGVGAAVHGGDALERQEVVHHREQALLHLATVPSVDDDLLLAGDVEHHGGVAVQAQLLVVLDLGLAGVVDHEVGLLVKLGLVLRTDEHVGHKVCLPSHLHDEAHLHAGVLVRAAEAVHHIELLARELLLCQLFQSVPGLNRGGLVVVLVVLAGPPNGVARLVVHDDKFVLGRAAGEHTGHHVDGTEFGLDTTVITLETGLGLLVEQNLVRGVVEHLGHTGDAILLGQNGLVKSCHFVILFRVLNVLYFSDCKITAKP